MQRGRGDRATEGGKNRQPNFGFSTRTCRPFSFRRSQKLVEYPYPPMRRAPSRINSPRNGTSTARNLKVVLVEAADAGAVPLAGGARWPSGLLGGFTGTSLSGAHQALKQDP
jgi:hypothetical protein